MDKKQIKGSVKVVTKLQFEAVMLQYARIYGVHTLREVHSVIREALAHSDKAHHRFKEEVRRQVKGTKTETAFRLQMTLRDTESLDAPVPGIEDAVLLDTLVDNQEAAVEDKVLHNESARIIEELLAYLSHLPRASRPTTALMEDVLRMRYGIGCKTHTLEEVAFALGKTRERIRQIEVKSLNLAKSFLQKRGGRDAFL